MATAPKIYISDRIYIPRNEIDDKDFLERMCVKYQYNNRACSRCEHRHERHCDICDTCPAFEGKTTLYNKTKYAGQLVYGIHTGMRRELKNLLSRDISEYKFVDRRSAPPLDKRIKFILPLYPEQERVVEEFLKKGYGLIESPPRSGKTAMILAIGIRLGYRFAIIADQFEFLKQFEYHITGHKKSGIPKCTNIPELEEKLGRELYGYPRTKEDYENLQIMFLTYQQFIRKGSGDKRIALLNPNIGGAFVDEVHSSAAACYSTFVGRLKAKHKGGGSGTIERKDKKEFIVKAVIGPVVAVSTVETMAPTVYAQETGFVPKRQYPPTKIGWVYAMGALAKNAKRNAKIAKQAIKDIEAGESIIIPVIARKHATELCTRINKLAKKEVAVPFMAGTNREKTLADAKSGKIKVVAGIRRLLQRGLNVPRWSTIYEVIPISNRPNLKQETKRVCTPFAGKRPKVRLFYESAMGQSFGAAKKCIKDMEFFGYKFSGDSESQACFEALHGSRKTVKSRTAIKRF